MKSTEQIIAYIEGRLSVLEGYEPERAESYELRRILNYIKTDENGNSR